MAIVVVDVGKRYLRAATATPPDIATTSLKTSIQLIQPITDANNWPSDAFSNE
ncbi:MAG: hypothetical protein U1E87_01675 [Alphaproteobacteria bacterium]